MTKIVYNLLLALEQCDDKHNRCDYLMEHNEITYLLEYITNLQQENKQLKDNRIKLKHKLIDKFNETQETFYLDIIKIMEQIEKSDSNE